MHPKGKRKKQKIFLYYLKQELIVKLLSSICMGNTKLLIRLGDGCVSLKGGVWTKTCANLPFWESSLTLSCNFIKNEGFLK
jgi:hypothetical protein